MFEIIVRKSKNNFKPSKVMLNIDKKILKSLLVKLYHSTLNFKKQKKNYFLNFNFEKQFYFSV